MGYDVPRRRRTSEVSVPATGKVVYSRAGVVRVALIDDDERYPVEVLGAAGVGGVQVGDVVLVIVTEDAAWIAGKD